MACSRVNFTFNTWLPVFWLLILFNCSYFYLHLLSCFLFFSFCCPQHFPSSVFLYICRLLIILLQSSRRLSFLLLHLHTFSVIPFPYTVFLIIFLLLPFTYYLLIRLPSITLHIVLNVCLWSSHISSCKFYIGRVGFIEHKWFYDPFFIRLYNTSVSIDSKRNPTERYVLRPVIFAS